MQNLNPSVAEVLELFHIEKTFVKAQGPYLYDEQDVRYTDFIAQYGAIPLGYNPEVLWQAINEFRDASFPSMCQPSIPYYAQQLALQLTKMTPGDLQYCTLSQSGAEAIEAAIKLARSTTKKRKIVSCHKGFHGKTMGALHATGQTSYQKPFFMDSPDFLKIPYDNLTALEQVLAEQADQIAAFIVEPVQGEGGVRVPQDGYLQKAQELCAQHGVLFVLDEVQTGLGRMGNWFVCTELGITPDILIVSKALGGGLVPIAACVSSPRVWNDDFGKNHSSTFANNNFTSAIALAFLKHLEDSPQLLQDVKENGDYILERLQAIKDKWPGVIREVRGRGYLHAIEFEEITAEDSFEMANVCAQGGFAYLTSGFMLNVFKLRLMPFLNETTTLRIEPPLVISRADIDYMLESIDKFCEIVYFRDFYLMYRYMVGDNRLPGEVKDYRHRHRPIVSSPVGPDEKPDFTFAFLCHYPSYRDLQLNNPSFEQFNKDEMDLLLKFQADYTDPSDFIEMPAFRSPNGELIKGWLIAIPYGGKEILERPREEVVQSIRKGIEVGQELGADVTGLGAYTSIVTRGGLDVHDMDTTVTTGNGYTVIISVEALLNAADQVGAATHSATAGVIGANGSIGRIGAMLLAQRVPRLVLVGRSENAPANLRRLRKLANEVYAHALILQEEAGGIRSVILNLLDQPEPALLTDRYVEAKRRLTDLFDLDYQEGDEMPDLIDDVEALCAALGHEVPILCSVDLDETLPQMDLVLSATSTIGEFFPIDKFRPGAVVCDISRPANIGRSVQEARPDVLVIEGGLVQYPVPISFGQNLGYEPGVNLACLSETMLLTFEKKTRNYGIGGRIPIEDIYELQKIGKKHGFSLAALHSFEEVVQEEQLERIREFRTQYQLQKSIVVSP